MSKRQLKKHLEATLAHYKNFFEDARVYTSAENPSTDWFFAQYDQEHERHATTEEIIEQFVKEVDGNTLYLDKGETLVYGKIESFHFHQGRLRATRITLNAKMDDTVIATTVIEPFTDLFNHLETCFIEDLQENMKAIL